MNLPSFRAAYLFLCKISKDIILECLKIRLEQKPVEPSELSIRQLMRECKDALRLIIYLILKIVRVSHLDLLFLSDKSTSLALELQFMI